MEYTPTEWKNGDVITAEKLNKLEQGIANSNSGMLEVIMTAKGASDEEGFQLNKTWQEIYDAFPNVYIVQRSEDANETLDKSGIKSVGKDNSVYMVLPSLMPSFSTNSADDYPVVNNDSPK